MPLEPKGALNLRNVSKDLIRKCKKAAIDANMEGGMREFIIKTLADATAHIVLPKSSKESKTKV
jgi:hypothetical protein